MQPPPLSSMSARVTLETLRAIGASQTGAHRWLEPLQATCEAYGINTGERVAAFLAQIGHESQGLVHTTELWGPTAAQRRYEGRRDLGNVKPGDGLRYRGHGLIQITGRANHAAVRDRLRKRLGEHVPDFEERPELLAHEPWAALSAGDYWDSRHLNQLADAGDFEQLTRRINGGLNGYEDRLQRWRAVRREMGL